MLHQAGDGVKLVRFPHENEDEDQYGPGGKPCNQASDAERKSVKEIFHDDVLATLEQNDKTEKIQPGHEDQAQFPSHGRGVVETISREDLNRIDDHDEGQNKSTDKHERFFEKVQNALVPRQYLLRHGVIPWEGYGEPEQKARAPRR